MTLSTENGVMTAFVEEIGFHISRLTYRNMDLLKPSGDGHPTHGGVAHMIPFANRVRNGRFTYNRMTVQLDRDAPPHAIHGLIRNSMFELRPVENGVAGHASIDNEKFPWKYDLEISLLLHKDGFTVKYNVSNQSEEDGPLMIGSHPYFLFSGSWSLTGSNLREMLCEENYFPTGDMLLPVKSITSADNRVYDALFRSDGPLEANLGNISLKMITRKMPFFMIYNGLFSEGRSVAVEPMTGATDCFNNGIGLIDLKAGKDFRCSYTVIIDSND